MRRIALLAGLCPFMLLAQGQPEYAGRRLELSQQVTDGVFVALGGHEPQEDFLSFNQVASFYYLTGLREPDAALVMIKQKGSISGAIFFVQPKMPSREVWTGNRIGVEGIGIRTGIRGRNAAEMYKVLDSLATLGLPFNVAGDIGVRGADDETGQAAPRSPDEQIFDRLKRSHPNIKVNVVNEVVEHLRGHKSAAELTQIRNAVDITVRALREAIPTIKSGMNEFEIQAVIEFTFRRNGADRPSFSSIVGSGPNSTTLHYNANDRFKMYHFLPPV